MLRCQSLVKTATEGDITVVSTWMPKVGNWLSSLVAVIVILILCWKNLGSTAASVATIVLLFLGFLAVLTFPGNITGYATGPGLAGRAKLVRTNPVIGKGLTGEFGKKAIASASQKRQVLRNYSGNFWEFSRLHTVHRNSMASMGTEFGSFGSGEVQITPNQ